VEIGQTVSELDKAVAKFRSPSASALAISAAKRRFAGSGAESILTWLYQGLGFMCTPGSALFEAFNTKHGENKLACSLSLNEPAGASDWVEI
jgi:hypothetical protein